MTRSEAERDEVHAWCTWLSGRLLNKVGDDAEARAAAAEFKTAAAELAKRNTALEQERNAETKRALAAEAERDELRVKLLSLAPSEEIAAA